MSNLWIVIPAAGESRRFKEAGYATHKPLLNIKASTGKIAWMINHVIDTIPKGYPIITALPTGLKPNVGDLSIMECIEMTLDEMEDSSDKHYIQYINETVGQADTVYQTVKHLPLNDSVLVLDCDMILLTKDIKHLIKLLEVYDVSIAVTKTFDPNASRVDQIPFPTQFVEKRPISEWGIVGARAFKNVALLTSALSRTIDRCEYMHVEPYLSIAINHYPGTKFAHYIEDYIDLGTPDRIKESGWEVVNGDY